jgi:hypothetical protein
MPVNVASPPIQAIADSYGVTRQRLHQLRKRHGLAPEDFSNPDFVFSLLLASGRGSPLRSKLSNPSARIIIKGKLRRP